MQGLVLAESPLRISIPRCRGAAFPDKARFFLICHHTRGLYSVVKEPASERFDPRVSTSVVSPLCHWMPETDKTFIQPVTHALKRSFTRLVTLTRGTLTLLRLHHERPANVAGRRGSSEPVLLTHCFRQRGAERSKCEYWHLRF